ncbi:MAG: hypothetical protein K0Q47_483 [Sedimentibacter sp.]|jgi:hypothetical protein|nr:hypothetical protein [Sedimentibacter sp.]
MGFCHGDRVGGIGGIDSSLLFFFLLLVILYCTCGDRDLLD